MATKGIKLKDSSNNVILPVTSSDLVEVNYGGTSKILTNLLEENEQVTAEALIDLNNRISDSAPLVHSHVLYGECSTASTTAAKTVSIPNFELVNGTTFTIKFTNANFATTVPTLNVSGTGAKQMYRKFNGNFINIVGAFIQAGYRYTFIYNNDRYELINSDFETDDVIEIVATSKTWVGEGNEYQQSAQLSGFHFISGLCHINSNLSFSSSNLHILNTYKIIFTAAASLDYLTLLFGSGYSGNIENYNATAFSSWSTSVATNCIYDNSKIYINFYDENDETKPEYHRLNIISDCHTQANMWMYHVMNAPIGGGEDIVSYSHYAVLNTIYSSTAYSLTDEIRGVGSIRPNYTYICCADSSNHITNVTLGNNGLNEKNAPGIVFGVRTTHLNGQTRNLTNSNVVTVNYNEKFEEVFENVSSPAYTMMRYETPKIIMCDSFPNFSNAIRLKKYYSSSYLGYLKLTYGNTAAKSVWPQLTWGNNYMDISNADGNNTYEMYFYNGTYMRNYITADCAYDVPGTKILNADTVLQFGPLNTSDTSKYTLSISNNQIAFPPDSSTVLTQYTNIDKNSIATKTLTLSTGSGQQTITLSPLSGSSFNKSITVNDAAYAVRFYETSDERLKSNISPIAYDPSGIGIYSFVKNDSDKYSYGFVAQNVAVTHPELIGYSYNSTYMSVDYNSSLALLLASALNRIDELERRITELENK